MKTIIIINSVSIDCFLKDTIKSINQSLCLNFCLFFRFNDKMQISFIDGHCRTIPVTGYGYGTTIVADPPMSPLLNLGPHFSKGVCSRSFTLTNMGRRHQSLVWSTEGFSLTSRPLNKRHGSLAPINSKDMKFKVSVGHRLSHGFICIISGRYLPV